jgi:hypothetical protein
VNGVTDSGRHVRLQNPLPQAKFYPFKVRRNILEEFLSYSLRKDCARDPHITFTQHLGSTTIRF